VGLKLGAQPNDCFLCIGHNASLLILKWVSLPVLL
jgi:hypothetical protein